MIFHFQSQSVTFSEEDQEYYEKRFLTLEKYLGSEAGEDEDSIDVRVKILKNKHNSGDRFEATVTASCPHQGRFHAEVSSHDIKSCADKLHDKLKTQMTKFHKKGK